MTERKCLVFNFADIEVREREFFLIKGGERLPVEPTAFRVLLFLLRNPGQLVSKEEIVASVWNDIAVSDNSLTRAIAQLRRVLDDDPREPRYILTVPTLGYRFLCEVTVREDGFSSSGASGSSLAIEERPVTNDALDEPRHPQLAPPAIGSTEDKRRDAPKRSRKLLFAGPAAAVLLLIAAGFIVKGYIGAKSSPSFNPPHLVMEQRLTANPSDVPVSAAVISPDGKYLAYADTSGLYLREISSGETRPWALPKDFVALPRSWYPDNTHLLVVHLGPGPDPPSLYRLSILGSEPQELVSSARGGWVSPDGSRIAYLSSSNWGDLWIMDSDGMNARKVVSGPEPNEGPGQDWIYRVAWSPSGQHLAYIEFHPHNTPAPVEPIRSLRMVEPDGKSASVVLEDARLGEALWWGREDRILFSYREDPASAQRSYGVYSIRIDDLTGRAIGPPLPVSNAEGSINGMSGTADGRRLVLWRFRIATQVFLSDYDAGTRQWKEPRRLIPDTNENLAWAWTADSKALFFVSNRNGTWKLFKQAIDETSPEVLVEGRSISLPRLSADGTQVLYLSSSNPGDESFPAEVISKPIAGGAPRVLIQGKGITNFQCAMAPSTLCLFSQVDDRDFTFRVFDLEHGPGRELLKLPHQIWSLNGNWSLSPDGSKLVLFLDQHRIRFFSVATGATHDVAVKDWPLHHGDWGATGKTMFVPSHSRDGIPVILEVDQTGTAKVAVKGKPNTDFGWMIQSPDLRHALVGEIIPTDNNAWILNDF